MSGTMCGSCGKPGIKNMWGTWQHLNHEDYEILDHPFTPAEPSPEVAPTQDASSDTLSRQCTSSAKQSGQISDELYDRTLAAYENRAVPAVAPRETQTGISLDLKADYRDCVNWHNGSYIKHLIERIWALEGKRA